MATALETVMTKIWALSPSRFALRSCSVRPLPSAFRVGASSGLGASRIDARLAARRGLEVAECSRLLTHRMNLQHTNNRAMTPKNLEKN